MTGGCRAGTTASGWAPSSSPPWTGGGPRAARTPTPRWCSSAIPWAGWSARWYIEKCGGAEVTRKLITLGTPYRGAARALDQLVNGAHHGLGPFRLDLTRFARSMPSLHQLLPEYACIEQGGDLAKTTDITLPELDTAMVTDAMRFHTDLHDAEASRPESLAATHAIVGTGQADRHHRAAGRRPHRADRHLPGRGPVRGLHRADRRGLPARRADGQQHAAPRPRQARQPAAQHRRPRRGRRHPDRQQPSSSRQPSPSPCAWTHPTSRWPARPSPCTSRPPSPPGRPSASPSPARPAHSSTHACSGHPTGRCTTIDGLAPGAYTIDVAGTDPASPFAPVSSDILIWESPAAGRSTG